MRAPEAEGLEHLEGTDREVVLRRDERQRHAVPDESAQRDQGLESGHSCPSHDEPQRVIVRMRVACHRPRVLTTAGAAIGVQSPIASVVTTDATVPARWRRAAYFGGPTT
jgi:hypothetical protein